jgi:hypothetical protein
MSFITNPKMLRVMCHRMISIADPRPCGSDATVDRMISLPTDTEGIWKVQYTVSLCDLHGEEFDTLQSNVVIRYSDRKSL